MSRVSSYGGPSGVAGSERLRQKLSSTPGLHLLSSSTLGEAGFLAVAGDSQDERVFHRTYGAARNFYAIASNLKQVARRESWLNRKDPCGPVVKETIVFDGSADADELCNGRAPALLVEEVDGQHCNRPGPTDDATREGPVEAVHEVSSNDSQVIEDVELEKSSGTSSSVDDLFGLSGSQGSESSLLATHLVAGALRGVRPGLETQQPSIALAEVEGSLSTSPILAGQVAQTSRVGKCEADPADNEAILSYEKLQEVETGEGLQDFENDRSKDLAAIVIQRYWRGWQERKHLKEVEARIVFLQSLVRRNKELKQYHEKMEAALVLQKFWRTVQSTQALRHLKSEQALREHRKIYNAAIVVQKYWRSVRSKRLLNNLRKDRDVRAQQRNNNAAVVLQKHWRGQRGRCPVKVLKMEQVAREQERIEDAAVVLQKHWRARLGRCLVKYLKMEQAVKEKQRIDAAAIVMQKYCRGEQARCLIKHLRLEQVTKEKQRFDDAAVVVQKHWRDRRGRCLVKYLKMEQAVKENQRIDSAAIVLQKYCRARQVRSLTKHLRSEQVSREKQRTDDAAVVMQKHWRGLRGRGFVKQLKIDQDLKDQQRLHNATIVLQKCWRAQQGRRLVELVTLELAAREQLRIDDAAIVLQKHWRAKQGRFVLRHLKLERVASEQLRTDNAAIVLQRHWKAMQGRCLLKYLKMEKVAREYQRTTDAAIVLQKHWRENQGRSYVKYLKLEQLSKEHQRIDHAAIVVQKLWRAQQSRCLVKCLRMEQAVREKQRIDHAATVIQKHCRAQQGRCLVNRLRVEQAGREKQRIDQAAVVLQKHWRGRCGRFLVKQKRTELDVEFQRVNRAAIMLQKLWRARQGRALVEHMRTERLVRQREMDDATTVLQKYWRGQQSRCLGTDLKKKQLEENAVLVLKKFWRAKQSRLTVNDLKLELAARERHRACAVTTLQKHWRARQSILLVKRLKMEAADQQRLYKAATILQKHWRGRQSRLLLKHLKCEQTCRELERVEIAALALQKCWRRCQSKQFVKAMYLEQAARERAALCIQARVRGNATRVKLKAALTIQKAWQLCWSSRVTVSAVSFQHAFPSSTDEKRKIQAIIILQAYARGLVAKRRLAQTPKSASLSLQPNHTSNKTFRETGLAADTNPHVMFSGSDLYARCLTEAEDSLEYPPSSSVVHHGDAGVKSVDQTNSSPITSLKHDPYASQGLGGEFSATSVGDVQLQKNRVQEDWNYVAVDQLEECLDTCLASLRPLPSGSQHCLPGLDVPEKSQQFIAMDQNVENGKYVDRPSTGTSEVAQKGPRTSLDIGENDNEPSNLIGNAADKSRTQSDPVSSQATPIDGTDHVEISSGPLQETGSQQIANPVQGRHLGRQTLKQNEQRLKQFAQVFLLQRHIALQQQRAQAAPPFPPPTSSGAEIPCQIVNQPLEVESRDQRDVAVDSTSKHIDAKLSQVDAGRPKDCHIVCEITDPNDDQTAMRTFHVDQNSAPKQVVERPGPDVVLDMVLLLRRIEAEYGTSETAFEGESSTWCTSGCGDIEEGVPLLDRNLGSMRRESSMAKFANAVSMKHISIPDVNAVLLVFIAMVVYTRTVCKGLLFGARQTHRRP